MATNEGEERAGKPAAQTEFTSRQVRRSEHYNGCLIRHAWHLDQWKYFAAGAVGGGLLSAATPRAVAQAVPFGRILPFMALGVAGIWADHGVVTNRCFEEAVRRMHEDAAARPDADWREPGHF